MQMYSLLRHTWLKADSMWNTWTYDGPKGAGYNRSKSGYSDTWKMRNRKKL